MRRATVAAERLETIVGSKLGLVSQIRAAAFAHDLGKLGAENQHVLATSASRPLAFNHVDAGVAGLLRVGCLHAAVLAQAHHKGLASIPAERVRGKEAFRDSDLLERTARELEQYLAEARELVQPPELRVGTALPWDGLTWRLGLSCLVDADHTDTAAHYSGEPDPPYKARWAERLESLDRYATALAESKADAPRTAIRSEIYRACREAPILPSLRACDAPVGIGKTTAVMAHLLRVAQERSLQHIVVVLPFTNIITQAVKVYRAALVLPGEDPGAVVGEHHHRIDLANPSLRMLATLWRAPITVTTAVQFFETLAGHHPARLRKLHELPASAVFVDEAHAAIPAALWPETWRWIQALAEKWGCHFVFASGSLVRFWELPEVATNPIVLPDLVPQALRQRASKAETQRVSYSRVAQGLSRRELLDLVLDQPGPRLLVVNTVQTAAVLAQELRSRGESVTHVSTALCPDDRDLVVDRMGKRLAARGDADWTLVATSCVEAGLDISFRTGFRESASTSSLIQVGGRVARHGEVENGVVWDFRVLSDGLVTNHPGLGTPREVLDGVFREGLLGLPPAEAATEAMRREIRLEPRRLAAELRNLEAALDFPGVAQGYRVIATDTRIVVVDRALCERIRSGERVPHLELLRRSVQLWSSKIRRLALPALVEGNDNDENALYEWPYEYDSKFLGIMKGALGIIRGDPEVFIL